MNVRCLITGLGDLRLREHFTKLLKPPSIDSLRFSMYGTQWGFTPSQWKKNSRLLYEPLTNFSRNTCTPKWGTSPRHVYKLLPGRTGHYFCNAFLVLILASYPTPIRRREDIVRNPMDLGSITRSNDYPNKMRFFTEEIKEMQYLHVALSETFRLHPLFLLNAKELIEDELVLHCRSLFRKGAVVL